MPQIPFNPSYVPGGSVSILRPPAQPSNRASSPVISPFSPKSGFGSIARGRQAQTQAAQQEAANSNLQNIMALLGGLTAGGGGGGGVSGAQIQALQDRGAQDRARIEALYKSYADMIGARRGDIEGNYATGTQNLSSAYNQAASTNQAAFDAARQAQTRQLQQLGLTEMAPPTNVQAQTEAAQQTERLKQAALAEQEANRQAAINQNISLQNAASREGTQQLAAFDQRLADIISQMQMSRGGGGGGGGGASASDLIRAYLGAAELDLNTQKAANEAQMNALKFAQGGQTRDYAAEFQRLIDEYGFSEDTAIKLLGLG